MMQEIGSEFHFSNLGNGQGIPLPGSVLNSVLTFSGRTAIECVLQNEPGIKKVMLPSYCCYSMVKPFEEKGIDIAFYHVNYDEDFNYGMTIDSDTDCILWCNYFGYRYTMPDFSGFIDRGGIVIEDITHSLFSKQQYNVQSHYLIASLRKWGPLLCGGYCGSTKRIIKVDRMVYPPKSFLSLKKEAMLLKDRYLCGDHSIEKRAFLDMYNATNQWITENYSNLLIDEYSSNYLKHIDYESEYETRRSNAKVLYDGLKETKDIRFLFPIETMDCPLFVPIVVESGRRNEIRTKLIKNDIYCPIHWPKPNTSCNSNLYEIELSLICDQRYNAEDMERIVAVLCNYN